MLIEVNGCEINGKKHGEQLEVNDVQAKHLIKIGYAKEVKQVAKPAEVTVKAEPIKKPATKRATTKK